MINKISIAIAIIFGLLLCSCSNSVDNIKNRTWEGQLYRSGDNKQLSDVKLKVSNDTLFIFSNAIFGSDNDTLLLFPTDEKNETDSTFIFKNSEREKMFLTYTYEKTKKSEELFVVGKEYYMLLMVSSEDIFAPDGLGFYENIPVPRNAFMYLEGTYKGTMEMENQMEQMLMGMMNVKMKFVFEDGFKLKSYGSSFISSSKESETYIIRGDSIFLNDKQEAGFQVVDDGNTLVHQAEKYNITLKKTTTELKKTKNNKNTVAENSDESSYEAESIVKEYSDNEARADNKYKDKIIQVKGTVRRITKLSRGYAVVLYGETLGNVECYLKDKNQISEFSKGDNLMLRGNCEGLIMGLNVRFTNCELVKRY